MTASRVECFKVILEKQRNMRKNLKLCASLRLCFSAVKKNRMFGDTLLQALS
jgi:hypothetical protein